MGQVRDKKTGRFVRKYTKEERVLYAVWCSMKSRCYNPNNRCYKDYGGRGISICKEWKSDYMAFYNWSIKNGYKPGLSIDRINTNGNYCPENCRWATMAQQNRNYSRNHMIEYNGETKCLSDWADLFGIKRETVLFRLRQGKPLEEVFSPIDGRTTRWKK